VNPEQSFAKDLSNLQALVTYASEMQLHGSHAQRYPNLGRYRKCPFCARRRAENGPRCCNPAYSKTQRAWDEETGFHQIECVERVNPEPFSKTFLKRFRHKRHGQSKKFHIRHQTFLFQTYPELLQKAADEMQILLPAAEHIPAFAEKFWLWKNERADRKTRRQVNLARRITRGLA
jgi:hypothetical protein